MTYIPVAQRKEPGAPAAPGPFVAPRPLTSAYVPVAQRTSAAAAPKPLLDATKITLPSVVAAPPKPALFGGMQEPFDNTPLGVAKNTVFGIPGVLKDIAQETARNIGSAGVTLGKLGGGDDTVQIPPNLQFIFKDQPIKSIEMRIVEAEPQVRQWAQDNEHTALAPLAAVVSKNPLAFAFGGVMGSVGLDLTPFGGLDKNAFKAIKNVKTEAEALQVLQKLNVSEDLAKEFVPEVIKTQSEADAKKLLTHIAETQRTTKAKVGVYTPVAERAAQEGVAVPKVDEVATTQKELEAQTFYRGVGPENAGSIDRFYSVDESVAGDYGKTYKASTGELPKNPLRINDKDELAARIGYEGDPFTEKLDVPLAEKFDTRAKAYAQKHGHDGILYEEGSFGAQEMHAFGPTPKAAGRENLKLEKMAQEAPTYEAFAKRVGVGPDTLEATARKKGFGSAQEFYQTAKAAGGDETRVLQAGARKRGLPTLPKLSQDAKAILNPEGLAKEKAALGEMKTGRDILREAADTMPGKQLSKYESRATGELPEVTGKDTKQALSGSGELVKSGKFTQEGDQIMQELGFSTHEEAQKALDDYRSLKSQIKDAEKSVRAHTQAYRDRKAVLDEVVRYVNAQGAARRERIAAVQEFFKFNEDDMSRILKGERDVRLMSEEEFAGFMKKLEGRATERYMLNQARNELQDTILNKELKKVDNIRRVMKLPKIENMSIGQLHDFNEFMQEFKVGDEFLSIRKLQTVEHTDLKGIYTYREAQERLLAQVNRERAAAGKDPLGLEDLNTIRPGELDRYRGDTTLARQNPFFDLMVQEKNKAFLTADMHALEARERIDELFKEARASRGRGLIDRLIPTDGFIFKWLEAADADKLKLAEDMTHEELDAAMYVRAWYAEARDYLLQQKVLKKFRTDYVTHTRRGFLEAWKEEAGYVSGMVDNSKDGPAKNFAKGLLAAFKESFAKYVQDEAYFNILDQATDQVLPLEKFFQFSMARTGELVPSKNVAKAFMHYLSTFEKKKALDSIIPKLDIYVHSLTPKKLTPRGLEFDSSLKKFFKEWMNTKKGRVTSDALIKPGGKIDWAMRTGVALTRLLDLGFSVPVGLASNFGAQIAAYRGLGEKAYATGVARLATAQGRAIVRKYAAFAGEPVLTKMRAADASLGDNIMSGVFALFSFADRKARQVYLLGKMTPEEWRAGAIETERLARLHNELGRHMPLENNSSILGKTALGKLGTQYKSWALPLISSTADDLSKLAHAVRTKDAGFIKTPEFLELLRTTMVSTVVGLGAYGVLADKTPAKDQSFAEKVAHKSAQDALSLIGAFDPTLWTQTPRLVQFLGDLATGLKQVALVEKNKAGELSGVNKLEQTITPAAVRQVLPPASTAKKAGTIKGLPPLPKIPKVKVPKLPKLNLPKL